MRSFIATLVLMSALAAAPAGADPAAPPAEHSIAKGPIAKGIRAIPPGVAQSERADSLLLGMGALALVLFLVDLSRRE